MISPVFVTPIIITYKFETIQRLKFAVYDADENAEVNNVVIAFFLLILDTVRSSGFHWGSH